MKSADRKRRRWWLYLLLPIALPVAALCLIGAIAIRLSDTLAPD